MDTGEWMEYPRAEAHSRSSGTEGEQVSDAMIEEAHLESAAHPLFIVRQPVFDRHSEVWAHELHYHGAPEGFSPQTATPALLNRVVREGEITQQQALQDKWTVLSMSCDALMNCSDGLGFNGTHAVALTAPALQAEEAVRAVQAIRAGGSRIILDSSVPPDVFDSLRRHADTIRFSLGGATPKDVIRFRRGMQDFPGDLLASDIATWEDYQATRALDFTYFQGPFFTKPYTVADQKMSTSTMARLQLLKELNAPEIDMGGLSDAIATDVSLSYRLLKYINSATFGLPHDIKSIQQAVSLLGLNEVRRWSMVVLMNDLDATPRGEELAYMALQRARFLEQMARDMPELSHSTETLFLLGLFSRLDALMAHDMASILKEIPLAPELKDALCGGRGTELGDMLDILDAVENGEWGIASALLAKYRASFTTAATGHLDASAWASRQMANIG